ncbi:MAG TPA: hypothetical protein VFN35_25025 [Ktedonobacteraceae bacterium]|nr:hypothetical protein [Ktedonobacteraceae bacterium]
MLLAGQDLNIIISADEPQIIEESSEKAYMSSESNAVLLRKKVANLGTIFSQAKSPRGITAEDLRVVEEALREEVLNEIEKFPDGLLQDFFAFPGQAIEVLPRAIMQISCAIESVEELEELRGLCRFQKAKLRSVCSESSAEVAIIYSVYREMCKDIETKSKELYNSYMHIYELMRHIGDCLKPSLEN